MNIQLSYIGMGLSPAAAGAPSPGRPAMRGAHRLPIGEDGEEGDQRKTCGFPLDSFPFDDGRGKYRNGDSAEASNEDRSFVQLLFVPNDFERRPRVFPTDACVRTGRKRDSQTFGICPQRTCIFHGASLLWHLFLALLPYKPLGLHAKLCAHSAVYPAESMG